MNLNLAFKRAVLIGGIGLALVVVGVALNNRTETAPAAPPPALAGNPEPVASSVAMPESAPATPPVYAVSPFGTPVQAIPAAQPIPQPGFQPAPPSGYVAYVAPTLARRVVQPRRAYRSYYYRPRTRVVVRRRPFKHSAAIVGGSAAGGAAIGALAGGGKGAIAGGLVGGVGGLVYDRLTHKKRVVVER